MSYSPSSDRQHELPLSSPPLRKRKLFPLKRAASNTMKRLFKTVITDQKRNGHERLTNARHQHGAEPRPPAWRGGTGRHGAARHGTAGAAAAGAPTRPRSPAQRSAPPRHLPSSPGNSMPGPAPPPAGEARSGAGDSEEQMEEPLPPDAATAPLCRIRPPATAVPPAPTAPPRPFMVAAPPAPRGTPPGRPAASWAAASRRGSSAAGGAAGGRSAAGPA